MLNTACSRYLHQRLTIDFAAPAVARRTHHAWRSLPGALLSEMLVNAKYLVFQFINAT
jgi:hypothetical protein